MKVEVKKEFGDMKRLVFDVLSKDEMSRNDDWRLVLLVLERMGEQMVRSGEVLVWHIDLNRTRGIQRFETVRRVRQEIQNVDGKWLPTDPNVLVRRKIREDAIREYYGEYSEVAQAYFSLKYWY